MTPRSPVSTWCAVLVAAWVGCGDDAERAEPADGGAGDAALMGELQACEMTPTCLGLYTCSELEACCATQRSPLACTMFMRAASALSGDPGCDKLSHDQGFLKAYASDPPCTAQ